MIKFDGFSRAIIPINEEKTDDNSFKKLRDTYGCKSDLEDSLSL